MTSKIGVEEAAITSDGQMQPVNAAVPGTVDSHLSEIKKIACRKGVKPGTMGLWWLPYVFFWPFLPIHAVLILMGGLCCAFMWQALTAVTRKTWYMQKARPFNARPPIWTYINTCWSHIAGSLVFIKTKGRLGLFMAGRDQLGGGRKHWWMFDGIWTWQYADIYEIVKNYQTRSVYFGNNWTSRPTIFPAGQNEPGGGNFLLWVNGPKHTVSRRALTHFVFGEQFQLHKQRFAALPEYLMGIIPRVPTDAADYLKMIKSNKGLGTEIITKALWFVLLGVKLTPEEWNWAKEAGDLALAYTLPRIAHNITCNYLANKVGKMRRNTVTILCRRPALVKLFTDFNDAFGEYRNVSVEACMDEFLFAVNLAGVLGTGQLFDSTLHALNRLTGAQVNRAWTDFPEKLRESIDGEQVSHTYTEAYNRNPIAFLKEVARLDPPVTSANCTTQSETEVRVSGCCGGTVKVPVGTGNQYCLALGNRDESQFPKPAVFDPFRRNIHRVLSWNGTFPFQEEVEAAGGRNSANKFDPMAVPTHDPNGKLGDTLPLPAEQSNNFNRVCPGRNIALQVCAMALGMCPALNQTGLLVKPDN